MSVKEDIENALRVAIERSKILENFPILPKPVVKRGPPKATNTNPPRGDWECSSLKMFAHRNKISASDLSNEIEFLFKEFKEDYNLLKSLECKSTSDGFLNFYETNEAKIEEECSYVNPLDNQCSLTNYEQDRSSFWKFLVDDPEDHEHDAGFMMNPIGVFESCFVEKHGTPRQPMLAPHTKGRLVLHSKFDSSCVDGLEDYSHVWIVFLFDKNEGSFRTRSKVKPPKFGGQKLGVFATRTPHRYNPIGLSLAKLDSIDKEILLCRNKDEKAIKVTIINFSGIDIVNDTPVLDIKPYHPADSVSCAQFPSWVRFQDGTNEIMKVSHDSSLYAELVVLFHKDVISILTTATKSDTLRFYNGKFEELIRAIEECLQQDPRTLHSRSKYNESNFFGFSLDRLDITFQVDDKTKRCLVLHVASWDPIIDGDDAPHRLKTRTQTWYVGICKLLKFQDRNVNNFYSMEEIFRDMETYR